MADTISLEERIARISTMEEALDKAAAAIRKFEQNLSDFEEAQGDISRLAAYYGSAEWFDDRDADEAGGLAVDLKRGVLSEDLAYDILEDYHDLVVHMLKLATDALKQGIA